MELYKINTSTRAHRGVRRLFISCEVRCNGVCASVWGKSAHQMYTTVGVCLCIFCFWLVHPLSRCSSLAANGEITTRKIRNRTLWINMRRMFFVSISPKKRLQHNNNDTKKFVDREQKRMFPDRTKRKSKKKATTIFQSMLVECRGLTFNSNTDALANIWTSWRCHAPALYALCWVVLLLLAYELIKTRCLAVEKLEKCNNSCAGCWINFPI